MIKTEKTTINERSWSVTQWPATLALDITFSFSKIFGPGLSAIKDPDLEAEIDFGTMAVKILDGIGSSADAQRLIIKLLRHTQIDNQEVNDRSFDFLFSGSNLLDLIPGIKFVLETNFGDFMNSAVGNTIKDFIAERKTKKEE